MSEHIIKGTSAPDFIPEQLSQHFVDITNGNHYISVGITAISDWKQTNGGGAGATSLLDLSDTPINYVDKSGKSVVVDDDELGVSFIDSLATMALSTALIDGCVLSIAVDTTKYNMSSGFGIHVDSTTNLGKPKLTLVTIPEVVNGSLTNLLTQTVTFINIDIAGLVVQRGAVSTPEQRRDTICIGGVSHANLATIDSTFGEVDVAFDVLAQLNDLMQAIGFFSTSGNQVSGKPGVLQISKATGTGYDRGRNFQANKKDPHNIIMPAQDPALLFASLRDGSLQSISTFFDPTVYDDGSATPVAVPGANNATISYVYIFSSNIIVYLYGQEVFSNFAAAVDAAGTESVIVPTDLANDALLLTRIISVKNATDAADSGQVKFITSTAISAGGASVSTLQQSYDISVNPLIELNSTNGTFSIADASTPLSTPLVQVSRNDQLLHYLTVEPAKVTVIELVSDGLTASRAVASDGSKKLVSSITTLAELAFVAGTDSNIQDQIDAKQDEITATTSADIFQGDKTFVPKLGLPISTATQSALDAKPDAYTDLDDTPGSLVAYRVPSVNDAGTALTFDAIKQMLFEVVFAATNTDEGTFYYDLLANSHVVYTASGEKLRYGRSIQGRGVNDTGVTITQGTVCLLDTFDDLAFQPRVRPASNRILIETTQVISVAINDILDGEEGELANIGPIIMPTNLWNDGDILWLGENGEMITTKPVAPDYAVRVGIVARGGEVTDGVILASVSPFLATDTQVNSDGFLNGTSVLLQGVSFVVDSNIIYVDVVNSEVGTRNLPFILGGVRFDLDTLTGSGAGGAARVALAAGADANTPQENYLYIEIVSTVPTLKSSITLPIGDIVILGVASVFDDVTMTANSDLPFSYQEWRNNTDQGNADGILQDITRNLRDLGAIYQSGINPTITITTNGGSLDNIEVTTSVGVIAQVHHAAFAAQTGVKYFVINSPDGSGGTEIKEIADLNEITEYTDGTTIPDDDRLGLNIMANQSSDGGEDILLVSLPDDGYTTDADAINDVSNFANTVVPTGAGLNNTAARLYRLVLKFNTAASGTWTNVLGANEFQEERGLSLGGSGGGAGGGGGGGITTFLELTDVPGTYTGAAGLSPVVNDLETALVYEAKKIVLTADLNVTVDYAGGGDYTNLQDAWDFITSFDPSIYKSIITITNVASLTVVGDMKLTQTGGSWNWITLNFGGGTDQVVPVGLTPVTFNTGGAGAVLYFIGCVTANIDGLLNQDIDLSGKYTSFLVTEKLTSGSFVGAHGSNLKFTMRNATKTGVSASSAAAISIANQSSFQCANVKVFGTNHICVRVTDGSFAGLNRSFFTGDENALFITGLSQVSTLSTEFSDDDGTPFVPTSGNTVQIQNGSTFFSSGTYPVSRDRYPTDVIPNYPSLEGTVWDEDFPLLTTGSLDGGFTAGGTWKLIRSGNAVTFSFYDAALAAAATSATSSALIPAEMRPTSNTTNLYDASGSSLFHCEVLTSGVFVTTQRNYDGTQTGVTAYGSGSITWVID